MPARKTPATRVLVVTPRFFPDIGGIETHVYETARRINRDGDVRVDVLTTDQHQAYPRVETVEGIQVTRVPAYPKQRDYLFAPRLAGMLSAGAYDLVHCQGIHTAVPIVAMAAAWRKKIPYVLTPHTGGHSSELRHGLRSTQWRALTPLVRHAERLICVATFESEMFTRLCRPAADRVRVIQNGVDITAEPSPLPDNRVVLSVGRFERYKGHHRLIAAMPHLLQAEPSARLLLVGRGGYEAELRRQVDDLGLGDRIGFRFIPPADRDGMVDVLRDARVVALLSDYEAHPVAVMEAVATGRPVLVSPSSGLAELAERGLARTVARPDEPRAVAAALARQFAEPSLPRSLDLPSWDDCAAALREVYLDVGK